MNTDDKNDDFLEIFQECELCHDIFDILQIRLTFEGSFYCDKCLKEYKEYADD